MDIIGEVHPHASNQAAYILVATDYFTKWVEVQSYKTISQNDVIKFIRERIVYRFGLPESVTTDKGSVFIGKKVTEFLQDFGVNCLSSSPYYPQANGLAEAANKVVIGILEKMVKSKPRNWHEDLLTTVWAYNTTKRSSTGTSPFRLTYGHEAVLPVEILIPSLRVAKQHLLTLDEHQEALLLDLEDLENDRLVALNKMLAQKARVARAYNKKLKRKVFNEGDLVWKLILPIGSKVRGMGKWSPNWEGPFRVKKVLSNNAYWLEHLDGKQFKQAINGKYLKLYLPTLYELRQGEQGPGATSIPEEESSLNK